MKAAHARALTLGATAAWLLPIGLVGYAAAQEPAGQGWGVVGSLLPELLTPAVCVAAAWWIVRRVPSSPTGPALAWTGGAISFVMALDVLTQSEFYESSLPATAHLPRSRPDCGHWTWWVCSPCCSCSLTDGVPAGSGGPSRWRTSARPR